MEQNQVKSGMGVPMFRESEVIGAMVAHSRKHRLFTDAEENLLSLIANQTAIALNSAEQIERQNDYLGALLNASKAIPKSGLDRKLIFDEIVKQAYLCLVSGGEQKATLSTIQLYDEATKTLYFESAYPTPFLQKLKAGVGDKRVIKRAPGIRIGIVGRTALEKKPQLVPNVMDDSDYYMFLKSTRSELAIPLLDGNRVRGVLDVESDQPAAFDTLHVKELEAVAEIAMIAIHNADQYEELEKTKRTAEASTALALMGMASSVWAHSIRGHANNIRELAEMMRSKLPPTDEYTPGLREQLDGKLARLERQARKILEKPLADPLLSAKGLGNFSIRLMLEERIAQLLRNEGYRQVTIKTMLDTLDADVTVRCNPEWMNRALDIIIDNAAKAMKKVDSSRWSLVVGAEVVGSSTTRKMVEITFTDKGPGIPPDLLPKFLKTRIDKTEDDSSSGVGVLMARTIIEAYGGRLDLKSTGSEGTTMVIKLPIADS